MSGQGQQPLWNPMTSTPRQAPAIQSTHSQQDTGDLLRRLQETTIQALRTSTTTMDHNGSSYGGGSSKGASPDNKGKGYDQTVVFDGLLPRIETRGQSKGSSKKSSSKKKDKNSQQY